MARNNIPSRSSFRLTQPIASPTWRHGWKNTCAAISALAALAKRVCLSPRHFVRRFKQAFGGTPAAFVENLRLDEARRRLSERTQTIENVASSVGFQSDDVFRRAFQRRFGVKPSSYRSRFDARAKSRSHRKKSVIYLAIIVAVLLRNVLTRQGPASGKGNGSIEANKGSIFKTNLRALLPHQNEGKAK